MHLRLLLVFQAALFAQLAAGTARCEEYSLSQRAVLFEEDPSNPPGQQYAGSVSWRTVQIKSAGQPDDVAVNADVDIPARNFKMTMSFRRNTDRSLPASHLVELRFSLPQDFAGGNISAAPGLLMKSGEQAKGAPLAGLAAKVKDGFFLYGLSDTPADRARNLGFLQERSWIDIPMNYSNQRRAILAIEKGLSGANAFRIGFAAWNQAPAMGANR